MPPEKHLGLSSYLRLEEPQVPVPLPPSSVKGSTTGSISVLGSKRKTTDLASKGALVMTGSASSAARIIPKIPLSGSGTDSGTGTPVETQGKQPSIDGSDMQTQGQGVERAADIVSVDDDDGEADELTPSKGKRQKKCTSDVWNYFTKKTVVVEVNGKKYEQLWGFCNFPNCNTKYRAECSNGTTGFRNHLKSSHSIVKGQLQLKRIMGKMSQQFNPTGMIKRPV